MKKLITISGCLAALAVMLPALRSSAFVTLDQTETRLGWDSEDGLVFRVGLNTIQLDEPTGHGALLVHLLPSNEVLFLHDPKLSLPRGGGLRLVYDAQTPAGVHLRVDRLMKRRPAPNAVALVQTFTLTASPPLTNDIEVELPLSLPVPPSQGGPSMVCPLKNGWARSFPLSGAPTQVEYRLGNAMTGKDTPALALPLVVFPNGWGARAVFADPMFSTVFSLRSETNQAQGSLRFGYAASKVPLAGPETRTFTIWLPDTMPFSKQFPAAVDAWFRLMLPDVPPCPKWLHDTAMVGYDFLSDDGKGWDRDVRLLGEWLKSSERRRVALCLHGWYDALGSYCYDSQTHRMKDQWVAFERTRKVHLTQAELKRRLRLAHDLGFRVLLYFADGVAADSGVPGYRDDWAYRDAKGNKISGWQGPDTFGPTYMRNLGNPEVVSWFTNYMSALLQTYGADIDGLVWDETFHAGLGQISPAPYPAYCDRTMMALVKTLTRQVHAFNPQKVFLASDCVGAYGWDTVPGYGMMAHGNYQDSHCDCVAWSYGLFPNWRNVLWSCNWFDMSDFQRTRWGVLKFGVPVAISNGWGDDCGPSEWTPRQRDAVLKLFRERLKMKAPVRFLTEDPAALLALSPDTHGQGDTIRAPAPGEVNWALASNGSRVSASSYERHGQGSASPAAWPPAGAIDGRCDDTAWGAGHGWVSRAGDPLPQWIEVDFGQERPVQRFVVVSYDKEKSHETAGKWGVRNYTIEVWDARKRQWKPVAEQASDFAVKAHVHPLASPVTTDKFRVVVNEVAPLDGQARLLQVEAWGK